MKVFIACSSGDRDLVMALISVLRNQGHDVLYPPEEIRVGDSLSLVSALVRSVDVIVALLASQNPNVYYELGVATGAGKPILVVAPSTEDLASDLSAIPYIQTSGNPLHDAQTVARRLSEFRIIEQIKHTFKSVNAALRAAWTDPAYLESLNSSEFEKLVADWFRENGYAVRFTQDTGDVGYDFSIDSTRHGGVILVEVKKMSRQSRVSVEAVNQLLSTIHMVGAVAGLVVSTSGYTSAAAAFGMTNSIALRTLEDLFKAKSEEDLLASGRFNEIVVSKNVRILEDVIEPSLKTLRDKFGKANISIDAHGFEQVPPISVDPAAIQTVVLILLENAVKYSPPGAIVSLDAHVVKEYVEIRFSNPSTRGIPPEDVEGIFKKGFRGAEGIAREPRGMGIGLFYAKNLVEIHGGSISVHLHDEMFAVTVRLPLLSDEITTKILSNKPFAADS